MPIIRRNKSTIYGLQADLANLQAADAAEVVARDSAISAAVTPVSELLATVNGDTSTVGSFRKAIADLIGNAPAALDTLKEIADYIAVNPDATVAAAITSHVDAAVAALKGSVSASMDTLAEIEAAVNAVSPVTAKLESLLVAGDNVVLSFAPRSGLDSIMNFATVRYIDVNGAAYDAPVSLDVSDSTGKTFIISANTPGEWNGNSVQVQYLY